MTFFPHTPRDETSTRGQIEYLKGEGNKAPSPKPGDRYILFGTVAGIGIGGGVGIFIPSFLIIGLIGGGIVGMLLGSLSYSFIMRRQRRR